MRERETKRPAKKSIVDGDSGRLQGKIKGVGNSQRGYFLQIIKKKYI